MSAPSEEGEVTSLGDSGYRVFIGGLERNTDEHDLERVFQKFGPVKTVFVCHDRPGHGYVIFEHLRDAEIAIRQLNDRTVCGVRIRLELASQSLKENPKEEASTTKSSRREFSSKSRSYFKPNFRPGRCFNCQDSGHFAFECPKNKHRRRTFHSIFDKSSSHHRDEPRRRKTKSRSRSRSPTQRHDKNNVASTAETERSPTSNRK